MDMKMIFRTLVFAILFVPLLLSCKAKSSEERDKAAMDSSKSKENTTVAGEAGSMWWHVAQFDSAFAYLYNGRSLGDNIVFQGKLHSTIIQRSKRRLSESQISEIRWLLDGTTDTSGDTISRADCFYPSQGFVFYQRGAIIAHISVCYRCGYNISVPKGREFSNERVTRIFERLGLPIVDDRVYESDSLENVWLVNW